MLCEIKGFWKKKKKTKKITYFYFPSLATFVFLADGFVCRTRHGDRLTRHSRAARRIRVTSVTGNEKVEKEKTRRGKIKTTTVDSRRTRTYVFPRSYNTFKYDTRRRRYFHKRAYKKQYSGSRLLIVFTTYAILIVS